MQKIQNKAVAADSHLENEGINGLNVQKHMYVQLVAADVMYAIIISTFLFAIKIDKFRNLINQNTKWLPNKMLPQPVIGYAETKSNDLIWQMTF